MTRGFGRNTPTAVQSSSQTASAASFRHRYFARTSMPGAEQNLFLRIRAPQLNKDSFLRLPQPVSKSAPRPQGGTGFGKPPLGDHRPEIFCLLRHSQPHCHSYATGLGILSGHRADIVDRSKMTHDRRAAGHSIRLRTIRGRQSGGLQHLATAHKLLGCPFNGIGSNARQYLIHIGIRVL